MNKKKIILPNLKGSYDKKKNLVSIDTKNEKIKIILKKNNIQKVFYSNSDQKIFREIKSSKFKTKIVGKKYFKRKVFHFLYPINEKYKLRVGITHHLDEGSWSSLPHKFENNLEKGFEEIFFYILKNKPYEAIQVGHGVWHDNKKVDRCWKVKDKTFEQIPMGYHPVVGLPKVRVNYIWAYIAKFKRWEKI